MTLSKIVWLADGDQPMAWSLIDAEGEVLETGVYPAGAAPTSNGERIMLIVPGQDVRLRRIRTEGASAAQAAAAALWAEREALATGPDQIRVILGPNLGDGTRWAAFVAAGRIEGWRALLDGLNAVVVPDCLLPTEPDETTDFEAIDLGERTALRGLSEALTVESDLVDLVVGDRTVCIASLESLAVRLGGLAQNPPIDLLARERAKALPSSPLRLLALLCVVSVLIAPLAAGLRDALLAQRLNDDSRSIAEAALGRTISTDPATEPEAALKRSLPVGDWTGVSATVFEAVQAVPGARLQRLSLADGQITVDVTYPAYSDLDALVAALKDRGISATVTATVNDEDRISSTLELDRR